MTEWVKKYRELFDKNDEEEERVCPECAKVPGDTVRYFNSLGSLKEHLLYHYRMKYYLDNYRQNKKSRHIPWHDEYKPLEMMQLEKYLDKELFADYLREAEDSRREEAEKKKEREKERHQRKLMVDRENERRRNELEKRIKSNAEIFNSDTDSDTPVLKKRAPEKIRIKKKKRAFQHESDEDKADRRAGGNSSQVQIEIRHTAPEAPKRAKKVKLQEHTLSYDAFVQSFQPSKFRLCPFCGAEFELSALEAHMALCDFL